MPNVQFTKGNKDYRLPIPQGDSVQPEFILRTQSDRANSYGVGEVVIPGVVLFRANETNLTLSEAKALLARKTTPRKQG